MAPNRPPQYFDFLSDLDAPEKTFVEQKLKKMVRTSRILGLALFVPVGLFYASYLLRWPFGLTLVLLLVGLALVLINMVYTLRWLFYERRSRAIRNLCGKCEYDLGGLDNPNVCPECGTPIVRPRDAQMR